MTPGCDFQQRHLSIRILGEEFGRATFALEDVDLHEVVRDSEPRERKTHFVAIPGTLHRIERIHSEFDPCARSLSESWFEPLKVEDKHLSCSPPEAYAYDRTDKVWQLQGRADFTKNIKLHSVQRSEQTQISRAAVNGNFILSLMRTPRSRGALRR